MFLIEKMELYPFSANEAHIIAYLLKERRGIEDKTTAQIAKETYSSKSALVRIAQKLDFKGWIDFKNAFLSELAYLDKHNTNIDVNFPFIAKDDYLSIAHKIASLEKEAIEDSLSLIDHKELSKTIDLINQADTLHIFAVSNNLLNAQEFQHNMSRIQKDVRIHYLHGEVLFDAYLAKKNSCALMISYSGETLTLKRIAKILKRHGIPMILLTSLGENSLSKEATSTLHLATGERLYSKIGTFSTDTSINYLLDVIYSCLFSLDYDKNLDIRKNAARIVEIERTSTSKLIKEEES